MDNKRLSCSLPVTSVLWVSLHFFFFLLGCWKMSDLESCSFRLIGKFFAFNLKISCFRLFQFDFKIKQNQYQVVVLLIWTRAKPQTLLCRTVALTFNKKPLPAAFIVSEQWQMMTSQVAERYLYWEWFAWNENQPEINLMWTQRLMADLKLPSRLVLTANFM